MINKLKNEEEKIEKITSKIINELKEPLKQLNDIQKMKVQIIENDVNQIILNNNKDINLIDKVFDKLIDILFYDYTLIEQSYLNLVNYCKNVDKDIADFYYQEYLKIVNEEEEAQDDE